MSTFINSTPATWQDAVKQLDEANQQFRKLRGIMTPLENKFVSQEISGAREKYRKLIEDGVIGEHTAAIQNLKAKLAEVEAKKARVTNSFNGPELAAQMAIYSQRIEHASKNGDLASLRAIYQEAKDSGDREKLRAAAESLQSVTAKFPASAQDMHGNPAIRAVNVLEKQARRDLQQMQTSPELQEAHKAAAEAVEILNQAGKQILRTAEAMGEVAPNGSSIHNESFNHALDRVHQDESGNFILKEN